MNCLRLNSILANGQKVGPCLFVLIVVVTLLFGLWPLDFYPENQVHWLKGEDGVQFHRQGGSSKSPGWGVAYSAAPMVTPVTSSMFQPATIEIYLEPHCEEGSGLRYVLSFCDGREPPPLVIGQWKTYLEIYCRVDGEDSTRGSRGIDLEDALSKGVRGFLTIVAGSDRTDVYVNGELARSFDVDSFLEFKDFRGRLVLGNSPTGEQPWLGSLYGLALYDKALAAAQVRQSYRRWSGDDEVSALRQDGPVVLYAFEERGGCRVHNSAGMENDLVIPRIYRSLRLQMLRPFWHGIEASRELARDVALNILGFIPFGWGAAVYLSQSRLSLSVRRCLAVVLLGMVLSLVIEMAQVALPGRDSSSLDLLCNTSGTALGVIVAWTARMYGRVARSEAT